MEDSLLLRFGAHQFLWKQHWTDNDLSILDEAHSLDLELFEISLGDDVAFDFQRLRRHAEDLGMEISIGPGNLWPMDCDISHDEPEIRRKGLSWHKKILDHAAECGAKAYCGAIYSHPGRVCHRSPPEDELPHAAENLYLLAEYAGKLNIRLVIEPMSRFRNHLINTSQQAVDLIRMAGHPNLSINLDTFHMITEERDYAAAIRAAAPRLWGIHACESDRGVPGGGLVPWLQVFEAILEVRHPIRILLETYRTGPEGFGLERGVFKDLCPNPAGFVNQGIGFLKSGSDSYKSSTG